MSRTRILIAEDLETDFELARREIRKLLPDSEFERVDTRDAFLHALATYQPDLVISDFRMPMFDGLTALRLTQEHAPDVPVIIFTGAMNEDTAVECMKAGAADYVIKEHLKRLGPAVVRTLEEKRERLRRRDAEAALNESNERLRQLAANVDFLLFLADVQDGHTQLTYLSPACEGVWGYAPERLYREPFCWLDRIHPDDLPRVKDATVRITSGKSGSEDVRYRSIRENGLRWMRTRVKTVPSPLGATFRVVGIAEDVTAQVEAEEEKKRLQAELIQAQKMETVGRLAGGVAHDFNNMICVILGYSQLLLNKVSGQEALVRELREIEKASERARDITSQLLAFSRKQMITPKILNVNQHIQRLRKTLGRLIREDIELRFSPDDRLWNIRFDPSQLDQMLVNLAVNARDAMPSGGTLSIETRNVAGSAAAWAKTAEQRSTDYVLLSVRDTGVGMSPEVLSHIFEPFFTTKGAGEGTGLGLSTVYGIVKQNNCHIEVSSEPGAGAVFHIFIPKSAEALRSEPTGELAASGGTERILLVEDNPQVRVLVAEMLQAVGYNVTAAESPGEALSICAGDARFDLLVSDVVMPGMSGPELRQRVLALQPEMRVLYISGYAPEAIRGHGATMTGVPFLQKPFDIKTLTQAVRTALAPQARSTSAG